MITEHNPSYKYDNNLEEREQEDKSWKVKILLETLFLNIVELA